MSDDKAGVTIINPGRRECTGDIHITPEAGGTVIHAKCNECGMSWTAPADAIPHG